MAVEQRTTGLTYEDLLEMFPDVDNVRRELIDGELVVTAAPSTRHQELVLELGARLLAYTKEHGGRAFVAPTDVFLSDSVVVEPDLLFVRRENMAQVEERCVRSAPDIVVEVSSPSTRRFELLRKRELYERFGVSEYWYVDLDADRVEVYRLVESRYGQPTLFDRQATLISELLPGLSIEIHELLGPPPQ